MKNSKQAGFREMRQAEKVAQRRADALAIKQGVAPAIIQQQNSVFKDNPFSNAPIKRNGRVVAI